MTVDQTAQLLTSDLQQQKRHIRSLSMTNVPGAAATSMLDSAAVIVAYQDVTAESSALLGHPEVDLAIRPEMEESFCSNFVCCGQYLPDLHALLQHYEDCHVRFEASQSVESMDDYGRLPMAGTARPESHTTSTNNKNTNVTAMDQSTAGVLKRSPRHGKRRRMLAVELEQCDFLTDDTNVVSAFDNTVLRTITAPVDQAYHGAMLKRSMSVPAGINYSRLSNLSGTSSESPLDQYRFIHSILSATVDNPDYHHHHHHMMGDVSMMTGRPYSTASNTTTNGNSQLSGNRDNSASASTSTPSTYHHNHQYLSAFDKGDRPYVCPVAGCGKAYKNPNGLKYHEKHGHDSASENVERPHRCSVSGCGKRYKNPNGLKYHMAHAHPNFVRHLSNGGIGMTRYNAPTTVPLTNTSFGGSASAAPPPLYRK